jgi:hypothetical protein
MYGRPTTRSQRGYTCLRPILMTDATILALCCLGRAFNEVNHRVERGRS